MRSLLMIPPTSPGTITPTEARLTESLPAGPDWAHEPKWDGFRCLAYRDGDAVALVSKSGKPLGRYFPEVASMLAALSQKRFVLGGELLIATGDRLSFAALQMRRHPAESRGRPPSASFMSFDCLVLGGKTLSRRPSPTAAPRSNPFMPGRAAIASIITAHKGRGRG